MRLLIDTHILLWMAAQPERLSSAARAAVEAPSNTVFVSAVTAWEIAIKQALGRLHFPLERWDEVIDGMRLEVLDLTSAHAIAAGLLPRHHDDPFDRALIAQAQVERLTLVSADHAVTRYDIAVLS